MQGVAWRHSLEFEAAKFISTPVGRAIEASVKALANLPEFIKRKAEVHDIASIASRKYVDFCNDSYSRIRIFGMERPIELATVYTSLDLIPEVSRSKLMTIEEANRAIHTEPENGISDIVGIIENPPGL